MQRIVSILFLLLVFGPGFVAPYIPGLPSPEVQNLDKEFSGPEVGHPLGFGENGVDVLSQIIWSGRTSFLLSFSSALAALMIGALVGFLAAWYQGWVDFIFLRIVEVFESFPGILLVVAMAAFLGPDPKHVFYVLVFNSWVGFAKMTRLLSLRLKKQDFIVAGQAMGNSPLRLFLRYFFPSMVPELSVLISQTMGASLIVESSLNFLGIGYPPGTPSWGAMLNQAREVLVSAPHLILFPSLALMMAVFSFQLIGDSLGRYTERA
jgi:peptide/nickel transport system permease protein